MNANNFSTLIRGLFLSCLISITACGPSQVSLDATSTQAAVWSIMTQTALIPSTISATPTNTPSVTPVPSPLTTYTPEPSQYIGDLAVGVLIAEADKYYSRGDYEMALALYTELIDHSVHQGVYLIGLYVLRGDTYDKLGVFDAAISNYLAAVSLGEKDGKVLNLICWDLGITGRPEEALPYCEQAVDADKSSASRDSRGLVYVQLGKFQDAIKDFHAVVDELKDSNDPDLQAIASGRQEWIQSLEAGLNPFTPEVLAKLRNEVSKISATSTPVPLTNPVKRSTIQNSALEAGYKFDEMDPSANQETLTGNLVKGSCRIVMKLVGPEAGITDALLQATGCSSEDQYGLTTWFLENLVSGKKEMAEAKVYFIVYVYPVISGHDETTGEKEIGNLVVETKRSGDSIPILEITARLKK